MDIQSVGVIGAVQMCNGSAHVFALAGYDVLLMDVDEAALGRAMDTIRGNLDRQVSRDKITAAARDTALGRIRTTPTLANLGKICYRLSGIYGVRFYRIR